MATGAGVYEANVITVSNNAWTSFVFGNERWDYGALHVAAPNGNRMTIATKGVYALDAQVSWAANATGVRGIMFKVNGTTIIKSRVEPTIGASYAHHSELSALFELNIDDYVEVQVFQNSGGNLTIASTAAYTPEYRIHLVEAT